MRRFLLPAVPHRATSDIPPEADAVAAARAARAEATRLTTLDYVRAAIRNKFFRSNKRNLVDCVGPEAEAEASRRDALRFTRAARAMCPEGVHVDRSHRRVLPPFAVNELMLMAAPIFVGCAALTTLLYWLHVPEGELDPAVAQASLEAVELRFRQEEDEVNRARALKLPNLRT